MMVTIPVGRMTEEHRKMYWLCLEAMKAYESALRPGNKIGEVFDAYDRTWDNSGIQKHWLNAA